MAQGKETTVVAAKWHDNLGLKAISVLTILAGVVIGAVAIAINGLQAFSIGETQAQQWGWGMGVLSIDIVGVFVMTVLASILWRQKKYFSSGGVYVVVALCSVFSLQMFYGFSASTRMKPAMEAEWKRTAELDARRRAEGISDSRMADHMQHLRTEAAKATSNLKQSSTRSERLAARDARQDALKAQREAAAAPVVVEADPIRTITDPQAFAIASDLGVEETTVQKGQGIFMGVLLYLVHIVAVAGGVGIWPTGPAILAAAKKEEFPTEADNDNAEAAPAVEPQAPTQELPKAEQPEVRALPGIAANDDTDDVVGRMIKQDAALPQLVRGTGDHLKESARFFEEGTHEIPGARLSPADLYDAYASWAQSTLGYAPMNANAFLSCVNEFTRANRYGLRKAKNTGPTKTRTFYIGRLPKTALIEAPLLPLSVAA